MEATLFPSVPSSAIFPQFPSSYQRNSQRITLPYLNRTLIISVDDIVCFEGEGNYTYLHTRDRKKYLMSKTLKEFEKILNGTVFLRIHKSYIVNAAYVQRSLFNNDCRIRLANGNEVNISRRRVKEISGQLMQYWQRLVN